MDRAGKQYWDQHWDTIAHSAFRPDSTALRDYRDVALAALLRHALAGLPSGAHVLEAGCADSTILAYVGAQGYAITGVDYSPAGCAKFRERLNGRPAQIVCADIFNPPESVRRCADLVLSVGLVEHFEDTAACVKALAALVRPGGRLLTIIPNMRGLVGLTQKILAPSIYNVHVPVSLSQLVAAHGPCESGYLLPMGFQVVNFHEPNVTRAGAWMRRMTIAALARLSWACWKLPLPGSELLSPYLYCLAHIS